MGEFEGKSLIDREKFGEKKLRVREMVLALSLIFGKRNGLTLSARQTVSA